MPALPADFLPADLRSAYPVEELLQGLLTASLSGVALYTPIRGADGTLVDFAIDLLNPAAQRILGQPARPSGTYLQHYPHTIETGVFAFHREAFEVGEPAQLEVNYQGDSLDNYFRLSAQRVGQGLLVSFTDTSHEPRTAVEVALRESQAREQAARAEAERERGQMQALLQQAPVAIGLLQGPELRVATVNPLLSAMWGRTPADVLHRPLFEAVPELQGQGFEELLQQVLTTRVPYVGTETPAQMMRDGRLQTTYYNFVYQPFYDAQGAVQGVLNVALEVTEQVRARQQVQALNEELLAVNAELQAATDHLEHARAEAEEQRARLHEVLWQLPAMVATYRGPGHVYDFVGPLYQKYFPARQLQGLPISQALPELAGQGYFEVFNRVYQTGETYHSYEQETWVDSASSGRLERHYFNVSIQATYDARGQVQGLLNFAYDVTEQVEARRQMQAQEQLTNYLNEELAATNEELQAANEEIRFNNTALELVHLDLHQLNQTLEMRVRQRTQEVQLARAAAETQRQRIERLFMQAPAAICILDGPNLVYELVNPSYQQLFPGRALLGQPLLEALPELADQPVWHSLRRVYTTGETHQEVGRHILVAKHPGAPPEDFYFSYTQQARYDEHGRVDGVLVFTFDVTEQVRARQRVQELNEELAAINEELQASNQELNLTNQQLTRTNVDLDNFIYTASHDLKAPISNIEGLLHTLDDELPEADRPEEITFIMSLMQESVERFKRTIGHLTDISKLQQEYARPASQVSLAEVVEEVRLDLVPLLHATQAQLKVDLQGCTPLAFSEKNLRSVVYNLLSNALKYRHPARPARVRISCHEADGYQVLTVQDNGLGIDLTGKSRLFQMFQRLHTHVEGSGIGLYMVKRIVENVGGRIEVESQVDVGTTFTVWLPRT